VNRCSLKYS